MIGKTSSSEEPQKTIAAGCSKRVVSGDARSIWLANVQIDEMLRCRLILETTQSDRLRSMAQSSQGRGEVDCLYQLASEVQYEISQGNDAKEQKTEFATLLNAVIGPCFKGEILH